MNTLVYADVPAEKTSGASTIASTFQQLSTQLRRCGCRLDDRVFHSGKCPLESGAFMNGVHEAFLALGAFTVLSTVVFGRLKPGDGGSLNRERDVEKEVHVGD